MTWRCSCCVLYVRFAQGTCFSTRSHGMKSQIGRSFSITTTTLGGSRCTFATWWTWEWNTQISIGSLLMDLSQLPRGKTLSQWLDLTKTTSNRIKSWICMVWPSDWLMSVSRDVPIAISHVNNAFHIFRTLNHITSTLLLYDISKIR